MCGIAGFITTRGSEQPARTISTMLETLRRRGPDGTSWLGVTHDDEHIWQKEGNVQPQNFFRLAFGCSRLAIQDRSHDGLQPIYSNNGEICVVLNGEIFNFIELRSDLLRFGYHFNTKTDTEVVANCFQQYGNDCFAKFNGQFALAIFDIKKNKILLARDRLGIVPLFIDSKFDKFSFASEIKAIKQFQEITPKINKRQVAAIVGLPYKIHWPLGSTLFEGVESVKPGYFYTLDINDLKLSREQFWDFHAGSKLVSSNFREVKEYVRETLVDAVRIRLRGDRKTAFIVSGGIDSSAVLGIARELLNTQPKTFSLNISDERFNEKNEIEEVLNFNHCEHNFIEVSENHVVTLFDEVLDSCDEPLATPNAVLHGIMSRAINESGVKIVLNGVGGDEVFLGYHDHQLFALHEAKANNEWAFNREFGAWLTYQKRSRATFNEFQRFLSSNSPSASPDFLARSRGVDYRYLIADQYRDQINAWLFENNAKTAAAKQVDDLSRLTLPHSIRMDDNCYLSVAVEARQPFLDHRLIEAGLSIPLNYKLRQGFSKFVLRQAVRDFIPINRRLDRRKIGLNLPIDEWFRSGLKNWVHEKLGTRDAPLYEFAEYQGVLRLLDEHMNSSANHSLKIWDLVSLENWLRRYS